MRPAKTKASLVFVSLFAAWAVFGGVPATGPLRVSSKHPRYFTGKADTPIYPAGSQAGSYRVECFNPPTGCSTGSGDAEALEGKHEFTMPFDSASVLYLKADRAAVRPTVYAWFPVHFGSWKTDGISWDCLTHLCFRSVELAADGTIRRVSVNPPKDFAETAHRHGVKVTVLVWTRSRADSDTYLARFPQEAANHLLAYVKENNLDGVNIDDEQMGATNAVAQAPNRQLVTRFFQILADTFKTVDPHYHRYCYPSGDAFVQGWFNDARAWRAKLGWIREQALGGIGIWVLDCVNNPPGTWELLRHYSSLAPANSFSNAVRQ